MPEDIAVKTITFFWETEDDHTSLNEAQARGWAQLNNYLFVKQKRIPIIQKIIPASPAIFTVIRGEPLIFHGNDCYDQFINKYNEE
jgi:hypothetical protein